MGMALKPYYYIHNEIYENIHLSIRLQIISLIYSMLLFCVNIVIVF